MHCEYIVFETALLLAKVCRNLTGRFLVTVHSEFDEYEIYQKLTCLEHLIFLRDSLGIIPAVHFSEKATSTKKI